MTRLDIGSAVEQIVSAVLAEHAGHGDIDVIARDATLHDEFGMDEADIIDVLLRAEDRFGVTLPDDAIGFSSTITDIVDLVAMRLSEIAAPPPPLSPLQLASPSIAPDA
jgi:acyl carrier protein